MPSCVGVKLLIGGTTTGMKCNQRLRSAEVLSRETDEVAQMPELKCNKYSPCRAGPHTRAVWNATVSLAVFIS